MNLLKKITGGRIWRSIFRTGLPDTNYRRSLVILNNFFLHIHSAKVKKSSIKFTTTFYLGGLSFALFLILTVTGIFVMFYYHPSVPLAFQDMKDLEFVVSNGKFLRNLHRWAAHAMVLLVSLHMLRVFFARAFKPPREFNWVIGVILLTLTLLLSYTGYLLPWDQLAYWGVSVGTNMMKAVPVFGEKIRFLLIGGNIISANALLRFYVLHCVILPLIMALLIGVHFWRIRKDGGLGTNSESEPASRDIIMGGTLTSRKAEFNSHSIKDKSE
ncbi:MAG: DUF4405 domain-containing protein [Candidatus Glassbacteria bacterium]|nr:DUF4405 domain-containing protein [Candidatus Glassbacteria bacterium]